MSEATVPLEADAVWRVGCAGWSMPTTAAPGLPATGSHLERYARVFDCVEINSSFYRPHRYATYARWSASVPSAFRFSVKVPRAMTHEQRLRGTEALLDAFLPGVSGLGEKLGCLLIQLPPSLVFDAATAHAFFAALRDRTSAVVVLEPRNASWFSVDTYGLAHAFDVDWVWAHPRPGGIDAAPVFEPRRLLYLRLHGAPHLYHSAYDGAFIDDIAERLVTAKQAGQSAWCIFDNTARGHAVPNARDALDRLESGPTSASRR